MPVIPELVITGYLVSRLIHTSVVIELFSVRR